MIKKFRTIEAIVDTGATLCTIPEIVAKEFGIRVGKRIIHHWQANSPLVAKSTKIKIRWNNKIYNLQASSISIKRKHLRAIKLGEECKRPRFPHPLAYRIILGLNFIDLLSEKEKNEII